MADTNVYSVIFSLSSTVKEGYGDTYPIYRQLMQEVCRCDFMTDRMVRIDSIFIRNTELVIRGRCCESTDYTTCGEFELVQDAFRPEGIHYVLILFAQ